jgi:hypothetical protein
MYIDPDGEDSEPVDKDEIIIYAELEVVVITSSRIPPPPKNHARDIFRAGMSLTLIALEEPIPYDEVIIGIGTCVVTAIAYLDFMNNMRRYNALIRGQKAKEKTQGNYKSINPKKQAREDGKAKRENQPASERYAKDKAKAKAKAEGHDARRKAHDAKEKGAPDRTKKQIDEDYEIK